MCILQNEKYQVSVVQAVEWRAGRKVTENNFHQVLQSPLIITKVIPTKRHAIENYNM